MHRDAQTAVVLLASITRVGEETATLMWANLPAIYSQEVLSIKLNMNNKDFYFLVKHGLYEHKGTASDITATITEGHRSSQTL